MGMFIVILSQNDVGKLLLILSCANRKFDNLMLSANFKILHLLYKGLTDGQGVESPGLKKLVLGQQHFSEKYIKYL